MIILGDLCRPRTIIFILENVELAPKESEIHLNLHQTERNIIWWGGYMARQPSQAVPCARRCSGSSTCSSGSCCSRSRSGWRRWTAWCAAVCSRSISARYPPPTPRAWQVAHPKIAIYALSLQIFFCRAQYYRS